MKARKTGLLLCLLAALALAVDGVRGQVVPLPVEPGRIESDPRYRLTGLIDAYYGTGSGAVVAHPRVVLSCAHVIYDPDFRRWLSGARWFRGYNESSGPERADGQVLNGYFYWRAYAGAFRAAERARRRPFGGLRAIAREFNLDAVAYFSYRDDLGNGEFASAFDDGAPALRTGAEKWITGYPGGRYEEGDPLEYRQHVTGPISEPLRREVRTAPRYLTLDDFAETGSGNSGGPVWMQDSSGEYAVVGILVSGAESETEGFSSIGVHATSARSRQLVDRAVETTGLESAVSSVSASFADSPVEIPDAETRVRRGRERLFPGALVQSVRVSGLPSFLNDVRLDLEIEHGDRTDLLILIQAPRRTRYPLYVGEVDDPGDKVSFNDEDVPMFYGINPNGRWRIYVVDYVPGDTGRLISATIRISAR